MSNMSAYEQAYACAVVRNPTLTAVEWEAIALAAVRGDK